MGKGFSASVWLLYGPRKVLKINQISCDFEEEKKPRYKHPKHYLLQQPSSCCHPNRNQMHYRWLGPLGSWT